MANAAATLFATYVESKGITARFIDEEEKVVRIGCKMNNTSASMYFFFSDDCEDVAIRVREFLSVPKDKIDSMYKVVNECNNNFRWIKFVINEEEAEVSAENDAVIQLDSCAEECYELMMRLASIIDDAYPVFMKAMWA